MPTTRPREHVVPTNLPPRLKSEEICPILHSGDRLSEETYAGIAADLAAGQTVSRIVRRWKTHHCTVAAVRTREAAVIEKQREHLKSLLAVAVQLSVEKLIEALDEDKVPAGALALATGILWDKHRQAEGEPTQVIEVKRTATLDQVKKELDSLRLGKDVVEAEMSDAEPAGPADPASRVSKETRGAGSAPEESPR